MDTQNWPIVTATEQDRIDEIVEHCRKALADVGFPTRDPKFPFVMHHERMRIRLRNSRIKPRHADVAYLLARWARERSEGFANAYAWQAVTGALLAMSRQTSPAVPVPDCIRSGMATVGSGAEFEGWSKSNLNLLQARR